MNSDLTELEFKTLQEVAAFVAPFQTIKQALIFKHAEAFGETKDGHIDIAFTWLPEEKIAWNDRLSEEFDEVQSALRKWQKELGERLGRRVILHHDHPHPLQEVVSKTAILKALKNPAAQDGKAVLAPVSWEKLS